MKLWFCPECGIVKAFSETQENMGLQPFCDLHSETWPDGTFSRTVQMEPLPLRAETPVRRETETVPEPKRDGTEGETGKE